MGYWYCGQTLTPMFAEVSFYIIYQGEKKIFSAKQRTEKFSSKTYCNLTVIIVTFVT